MKLSQVLCAAAGVCTLPTWSAALVSDVTFDQDSQSRLATITYKIDEPAIVTVDIQTNRGDGVFASIGSGNLQGFVGDVNKLVATTDGAHTITWRPDLYWNQGKRITGDNVKAVVTAWATNAPPDYMVINLLDRDEVRYYVSAEALPYPVTNIRYKSEYLVMRRIHAAGIPWRMGSSIIDTPSRQADPLDVAHTVTLTEDYYMAIYNFTVGQWNRLSPATAPSGSYSTAPDDIPAWATSYEYLRGKLSDNIDWPTTGHQVKPGSAMANLRTSLGIEVDFPTEAQWEYACRAGTVTETYNGGTNTEAIAACNGWYKKGGVLECPVGCFAPNPWGLYDMYGGVLEWCLDRYNANVDHSTLPCVDPQGPSTSSTEDRRVCRGSAWNDVYGRMFTTWHSSGKPSTNYATNGFRLVAPCVAPNKTK